MSVYTGKDDYGETRRAWTDKQEELETSRINQGNRTRDVAGQKQEELRNYRKIRN